MKRILQSESFFLITQNIEDHEISDHIVNKINTLSNEKIELINEAASLLKETLKVVIPSLENTFSDTQHLEIIMIVVRVHRRSWSNC